MPSLPISIVSQTLYVDNNTCTYDSIKNTLLCTRAERIKPYVSQLKWFYHDYKKKIDTSPFLYF